MTSENSSQIIISDRTRRYKDRSTIGKRDSLAFSAVNGGVVSDHPTEYKSAYSKRLRRK